MAGSLISTYRVVSTTFRAESEKMIAQTVGGAVLPLMVVSANEFQLSNLQKRTSVRGSIGLIKLQRAHDGCLGADRR